MITRFLAVWGFKLLGGVSIALALYAALATHKWSHWKEIAGVLRIDLEEVRQLRAQALGRDRFTQSRAVGRRRTDGSRHADARQACQVGRDLIAVGAQDGCWSVERRLAALLDE